jgi:bifunctional NMN adenylyltransferase/nudix hydrolase
VKTKKHEIGVIVGRFQLDELHSGHETLINDVATRHERCLMLVGVSPVLGSKEHPLDFANREAMIKAKFPNILVLPILDNYSDEVWSQNIDKTIRTVFPVGNVCLYGGRDSFIDYYTGNFDCYEFPSVSHKSATEVRKDVGKKVVKSADFRKGIIYSTQNLYPRVFLTVDVAIIKEYDDKFYVMLGRKKDQTKWRFPGGFVDQDETLEQAGNREALEETGIDTNCFYLCSTVLDDWRYRNTSDSVLSCLLVSFDNDTSNAEAGDDLEDIKFVKLDDAHKEIIEEHKFFLDKVIANIKGE